MFLRELPFVCPDEVALADDLLAADEQAIHSMRAGEDEAGNGILGPSELETVRPPPNGRAPGWNAGIVVASLESR